MEVYFSDGDTAAAALMLAATACEVKVPKNQRHAKQPLSGGGLLDPWRSARDDRVSVDRELPGASDKGAVVGFSSGDEAGVEVDQSVVPSEGSRERCGVQGAPQTPATACDAALPLVRSAVIVEGSQASECCGLFTADASEFGHANDESERGPFSDAGNAQHEIEAEGEIVVGAQCPHDPQQLG